MLLTKCVLLARGRHVNVKAGVVPVGQGQLLLNGRDRVIDKEGVRPNPALEQRIIAQAADERVGFLNRPLLGLCVANLDDAVTQRGAHAALSHGRHDVVHVEILVVETGGAGADHLGAAHQHGRRHHLAGHGQLPHADAVVPAFHAEQTIALGEAAEQGHGRVGVGVDEAGHDQSVAQIRHRRGCAIECAPWLHSYDCAVLDEDAGVVQQRVLGVHGEDLCCSK